MNLLLLTRPPLLWIVLAEAVLVLATGFVAWHISQSRAVAAAVAVVPRTNARPNILPHPTAPLPRPSASATPSAGPTPGIRTDSQFLALQIDQLNRVEASFEDLEWRMTRAIVDGVQHYIERVVIPRLNASEGRG